MVRARTAHAALVARQMEKPHIVGCRDIAMDIAANQARIGDVAICASDWVTIDGDSGHLYLGRLETVTTRPERELAEVLRLSNEAGLAVIPRGGGTKIEWGNAPARADLILSTARLTEIIEHAWADLTVSVEAGCTIKQLRETLAQIGQRLALDPLWHSRATVGGGLAQTLAQQGIGGRRVHQLGRRRRDDVDAGPEQLGEQFIAGGSSSGTSH